jgi:predicted Zn-dependent protease
MRNNLRPAYRINWDGYYLDGQSPRRHEVAVTLAREGIHIRRQDGSTLWWAYDAIRPARPFRWADPVVLQNENNLGEAVVIPEPGFLDSLQQFAPGYAFPAPAPERIGTRVPLLLAALASILALGAGVYFWGIPALAQRAAEDIPTEWEERLGDAALEQLAPAAIRCTGVEQQTILDEIGERLMRASPPSSYHLRLLIIDNSMVNAFAVPGGRIVIFRGLLERTEHPEELAGVLAHEIQHVLLRHPLQAVFRQFSLRALAAVVAGDSTGMASALGAAGTVGGMRYQRGDEEAADRAAVRMLQAAQIDPEGLIQMLEKLESVHGEMPTALQYLSTHPLTAARIAALEELAQEPDHRAEPLLPGVDWSRMRQACDAEPDSESAEEQWRQTLEN